MHDTFFRERLSGLIQKANVSESQMSKDLGFDRTYLNNITSGRSLPHMRAFFSICDYLKVSPEAFFHTDTAQEEDVKAVEKAFSQLNDTTKLSFRELLVQLKRVE